MQITAPTPATFRQVEHTSNDDNMIDVVTEEVSGGQHRTMKRERAELKTWSEPFGLDSAKVYSQPRGGRRRYPISYPVPAVL